jgi:transcriptional regulator of NAD metabolism
MYTILLKDIKFITIILPSGYVRLDSSSSMKRRRMKRKVKKEEVRKC